MGQMRMNVFEEGNMRAKGNPYYEYSRYCKPSTNYR